MRKKNEIVVRDPLLDAIREIHEATSGEKQNKTNEPEIADIISFCERPDLLNIQASNFNLWPPQRIILKSFYMGTRGNENLNLTNEEWKWLYDNNKSEERDGVVYEKNIDDVIVKLLRKEKDGFNFSELNLCLGRRGSKTLLSSIISAYEAYKLLKIGGGNPHKFYGIPKGEDIHIINVALSQDQAGILFGMIRQRIMDAPFFQNRIQNATTTEIRLWTDTDLERKKNGKDVLDVKGSVVILCGHSNPDTLRGKSAVLILFDELAFYDETGKTPGSAFYTALEPSIKKFKKFGDARIVTISSPNVMTGIFYDLFQRASMKAKEPSLHRLSFQLPTWCVNQDIPYESLKEERIANPEGFCVEYGAQWAKSGTWGNYFDPGLVDKCIISGLEPHRRPIPKYSYYLHIDPANNGNRYVALLVAKEYYLNHLGRRRTRVILANIWCWEPEPGIGLMFNRIDQEVIQICEVYRPMAVTYDQWNSLQSIQNLRARGIRVLPPLSYNRGMKQRIYQNLTDMMSYYPKSELWLYDDPRLILEMKALKKRPTMRGISLITDKHGDIKTDDFVDCLAGAAATASENVVESLPPTTSVYINWGGR